MLIIVDKLKKEYAIETLMILSICLFLKTRWCPLKLDEIYLSTTVDISDHHNNITSNVIKKYNIFDY